MLAAEASPQPGALDGAALRRVVVVLSTEQIVSWGCMYYAFAALQSSITADTGGSGVAVTGAFSLSQVVSAGAGLWVGLHIDAYGPRRVMSLASVLATDWPSRTRRAWSSPVRAIDEPAADDTSSDAAGPTCGCWVLTSPPAGCTGSPGAR